MPNGGAGAYVVRASYLRVDAAQAYARRTTEVVKIRAAYKDLVGLGV